MPGGKLNNRLRSSLGRDGYRIDHFQETYEAILAVGEVADRLQVPAGSPLILVSRLGLDKKGILLYGVRNHMRTDNLKIKMTRTRALTQKRSRN